MVTSLVCPSCDGPKSRRAKLCAECRRADGRRDGRPEVSVANGIEVVSVFGPFASRVLLNVPTDFAGELLEGRPVSAFAPTGVIDGVRADLERLSSEDLRSSGLAAAALSLAMTVENPYTSATARASCAKELREYLAELRELAPPNEQPTPVDDIQSRVRAKLRSVPGGAAA